MSQRGLRKPSTVDHRCSQNKLNSSRKMETVNNFNVTKPKLTNLFKKDTCDVSDILSPYKNSVSAIDINLNDSVEDESDFKSPGFITKRSTLKQTNKSKRTVKPKTKFTKTKFKNTLDNYKKETVSEDGFSLDHIQMAIALSKSTAEQENISPVNEDTTELSSTQEKIATVRRTLEQFGFKSNKPCVNLNRSWSKLEVSKRSKHSKYRFITPILKLRTEEDRQALISSKISLVLSSNIYCEYSKWKNVASVYNKRLEKLIPENRSIFHLNQDDIKVQTKDIFYVKKLNLEASSFRCGTLLKNWNEIPGRDRSPVKYECETLNYEETMEHKINSRSEETVQEATRCDSPDLFDSDMDEDENCIADFAPKTEDHCIDLTQSSDEESESKRHVSSGRTNRSLSSENVSPLIKFTKEDLHKENIVDEIPNISKSNHTIIKDDSSSESVQNDLIIMQEKQENFIEKLNNAQREDSYMHVESDLLQSFLANSPRPAEEKFTNKDNESGDREDINDPISAIQGKISSILKIGEPHCSKFEAPLNLNFSSEWQPSESLNVTDYVINILNDNYSEQQDQSSQTSIEISDEELNYSTHFSTPKNQRLSVSKILVDNSYINSDDLETLEDGAEERPNQDLIVKTTNVTPILNYDAMNTPKITQELDKIGVKCLKRQRGAQLLKYIYEATHPIIETPNKLDSKIIKKRKLELDVGSNEDVGEAYVGGLMADEDIDENMFFEQRTSSKVASCKVPLHIVWHNFLSHNVDIHERMLLYEPLQLEDIHLRLKNLGFKFRKEDLLAFFDKKCINYRTEQRPKKRIRQKE